MKHFVIQWLLRFLCKSIVQIIYNSIPEIYITQTISLYLFKNILGENTIVLWMLLKTLTMSCTYTIFYL